MTPAEKEELQELVLRTCNSASRLGVSEARLLRTCQRWGWPTLTLPELQGEVEHLRKAALIAPVDKALRPDLYQWGTTAEGDRYLMKQGLI